MQWHKLDRALVQVLRSGAPSTPVRVIVQGQPDVVVVTAPRSGKPRARRHPLIGAFSTTLTRDDIRALSDDRAVTRISLDAPVRATSEPATEGTSYDRTDGETLHETLGLDVQGGVSIGDEPYRGNGRVVAVIDSGIEVSRDLADTNIVAFFDVTAGGAAVAPFDDHGHGTHIAGLIAGNGKASDGVYEGVAPRVGLVGYKVLDEAGVGYTSDVISAIEHTVATRETLGIDVINLSLGHPIYEPAASDPLVQAVHRAVEAGIVVVVSAGNYGTDPETGEVGYGGITSPGNAPGAITVGALDTNNTVARADDVVASYSARGPTWYDAYVKPDFVAPAHRLVAAAATEGALYEEYPSLRVVAYPADKTDDANEGSGKNPVVTAQYFRLSGTSMAAAITTGVVALMLDANSGAEHSDDEHLDDEADGAAMGGSAHRLGLTPNAVKAILQFTAVEMEGVDLLTQGSGSLNAVGAVRACACHRYQRAASASGGSLRTLFRPTSSAAPR